MNKQIGLGLAVLIGLITISLVANSIACRYGRGLYCSKVSDFDPNLTFLDYCKNPHSHADAVSASVRIIQDRLQIQDCQEAFQKLQDLEQIDLGRSGLKSLYPLANLNKLRSLLLLRNELSNLDGLQTLPHLERLSLSGNHVVKIDQLKKLTSLQWLDLSYNQIEDLNPLQDLKSMRLLRLDGNRIQSVMPLKELMELQDIHYFEGLSLEGIPLGVSVTKTEDNCPTQGVISPAVKKWCSGS